MKKVLSAMFVSFIAIQLSAQTEESEYSKFYKDSTYLILGENVNIRLNPDTAGKVIYKAGIGEKVRILENSEIWYTRNGYTANWYRVVFNNKGTKSEGYVWGGLLATKTIKSAVDPSIQFMYGISKVVPKEYFDEVYIHVKVLKDGKLIQHMELNAVGGLRTYNTAECIGNKGVDGIVDIFKINFNDGYCAGSFGDMYLFWDGNKLNHAKTLTEGFDAPYFSSNIFIFPTDEKGKKGYIINKSESGYQDDNDKVHIEERETITYKWDGTQLVVVKKQKK